MPKKATRKKVKKAAARTRQAKKPAKASPRKPQTTRAKKPKAKAAAKPRGISPEKQVPGGTLLGFVEDYFSHVGVIALTLRKPLAVGETIRVKGHTTDMTVPVGSIQIEHESLQSASAGDSVGIKVVDRARKGDAVYKIATTQSPLP